MGLVAKVGVGLAVEVTVGEVWAVATATAAVAAA